MSETAQTCMYNSSVIHIHTFRCITRYSEYELFQEIDDLIICYDYK